MYILLLARDALEAERLARAEAEKAREALEKRLSELEASEASASGEEEGEEEGEAGPALSADAILKKFTGTGKTSM